MFCPTPIAEGDRGLIMPFVKATTERKEACVHIRCFLRNVGHSRQYNPAN